MDVETFIEKYNTIRKWDGEIYDYVESLMDDNSDMVYFEGLLYNELLGQEEIGRYSIEIETGEVDEYDNYFELRICDSLGYVHYFLYKEDMNLDEKAYKMKKSAEVLKQIITIKKHISSEIDRLQRKEQIIETIESILTNKYLTQNGNN